MLRQSLDPARFVHIHLHELADGNERHFFRKEKSLAVLQDFHTSCGVKFQGGGVEHGVHVFVFIATIVIAIRGATEIEKGRGVAVVAVPAPPGDHEIALLEVFLVEPGVHAPQFDSDSESLLPLRLEFETYPFVTRGVCGPEQVDYREEFAVLIFDESIAVSILPADAFQFLSSAIRVVAEADGIVVTGD